METETHVISELEAFIYLFIDFVVLIAIIVFVWQSLRLLGVL